MKHTIQLGGLCSVLLAAVLLPQAAAKNSSCTISIPVTVSVTGSQAENMTAAVKLEAMESGNPMPEETTCTLTGNDKEQFEPITFTIPGDYDYRVWQCSTNTNYRTYDETVYTVTVRVTSDESGNLSAAFWTIQDSSEEKSGEINFQNQYTPPRQNHTPRNQTNTKTKTTVTTLKTVTQHHSNPKTGDDSPLARLGLTMTGSLLLLLVLAQLRRAE